MNTTHLFRCCLDTVPSFPPLASLGNTPPAQPVPFSASCLFVVVVPNPLVYGYKDKYLEGSFVFCVPLEK